MKVLSLKANADAVQAQNDALTAQISTIQSAIAGTVDTEVAVSAENTDANAGVVTNADTSNVTGTVAQA